MNFIFFICILNRSTVYSMDKNNEIFSNDKR